MPLRYMILPISDVIPNLSEEGLTLLSSVRKSKDETLLVRCINHEQERIKSIFKTEFDYVTFLSAYEVLSKEEVNNILNTPEWDLTSDE